MKKYTHSIRQIAGLVFLASLLASCGEAQEDTVPKATGESAPAIIQEATTQAGNSFDSIGSDPATGLPADVETYYKTMVFIHGTAQLMSKFDLAAITSSDDQSLILMLIAMPGVMDDHLIAANALPVPAGFEAAWEQATMAEANLMEALLDVLTTYDLESFAQAVASNEALASEAVVKAEAVLAAEYRASADDIAAANRAALTEMGEAYKTIASMLVVIQSEADGSGE